MTSFDRTAATELVEEAKKASVAVYLATDAPVADDLSRILKGLSASLVSAVEYIGELERRVKTVTDSTLAGLSDCEPDYGDYEISGRWVYDTLTAPVSTEPEKELK